MIANNFAETDGLQVALANSLRRFAAPAAPTVRSNNMSQRYILTIAFTLIGFGIGAILVKVFLGSPSWFDAKAIMYLCTAVAAVIGSVLGKYWK